MSFIAAQKTSAISKQRPICNACGSVCQFVWYLKKAQSAAEYFNQKQREASALEHFGEADSLHTVLRKLTDTYLVCQDCYQAKNLPHTMS